MAAKKAKKNYYRSRTPEDGLRRKLASGVPVHRLLHYHHGRDRLDQDLQELIGAGVLIHEIEVAVEQLADSGSMPDIDEWEKCQDVFTEFRGVLRHLASGIRRTLIIRTVQGAVDD